MKSRSKRMTSRVPIGSTGASDRSVAKKVLAKLVEAFPLPFPVHFRWNKNDDLSRAESFVRANKAGKRIGYIGLLDGEDSYTMHQLLAHEYAHLMAWDWSGNDHDAAWAVAYRECYQLLYGGH